MSRFAFSRLTSEWIDCVMSHVHIAETLLYEIAIPQPQGTGGSSMSSLSLSPTDRLELLWNCLKSTRDFFAVQFDRPLGDRPGVICMTSFDRIFSFLTILKLITIVDVPGWDLATVRREVNFAALLERQAIDLETMAVRRRTGCMHGSRSSTGSLAASASAAAVKASARTATVGDIIAPMTTAGAGTPGAGTPGAGTPEDPFLKLARRLRALQTLVVAQLENEDAAAAAAAARQLCAGVTGSGGPLFCPIKDACSSTAPPERPATSGAGTGAGDASVPSSSPAAPSATGMTTPMQIDGGAAAGPAEVMDFAQGLVNDLDGTNWQDLLNLSQDESVFTGLGLPLSAWGY